MHCQSLCHYNLYSAPLLLKFSDIVFICLCAVGLPFQIQDCQNVMLWLSYHLICRQLILSHELWNALKRTIRHGYWRNQYARSFRVLVNISFVSFWINRYCNCHGNHCFLLSRREIQGKYLLLVDYQYYTL